MNEVILMGRIATDLQLRYTNAGKAVMNFNIAVQRNYKNENNEYEADFIRCSVFGDRAELIAEYMEKGNRILIRGRIQTGSYEKDGRTVFTTDVFVNEFSFIDSKNTDKPSSKNEYRKPPKKKESSPFEQDDTIDISDDDLPF